MRQYGPAGARNIPVDRNPSTIVNGGGPGGPFAGGTNNLLATYTVPALRRALVEIAQGFEEVAVALAAGQTAVIDVLITPSGGAQTLVAQNFMGGAAPALTNRTVAAQGLTLKAGDLVEVRMVITAGAGTVSAGGGLKATEYDV